MKKVSPFAIHAQRNEAVSGFFQKILPIITKIAALVDMPVFQILKQAVQEYLTELDTGCSIHYSDLKKSDGVVDQTVKGTRAHIQALLVHPEEDIAKAARVVWKSIEQYGSPINLPFNESYAIVARMLRSLEAVDATALDKTLTTAWVRKLRVCYDEFQALYDQYTSEHQNLSHGRVKIKKSALNTAWRNMIDAINGLSAINPSQELDEVIDTINFHILARKNAVKQRQSRKTSDAQSETSESTNIDLIVESENEADKN